MKAAIIENGVVINIAKVADQAFADAQGWIVSDTAKIGDTYDGTTFTSPPPGPEPVPESISMRRFWQQLYLDGVTEAQAIATVENQLTDPQKTLVLIELEKSQVVFRNRPALVQLAPLLGYDTPEKMDTFFREASKLE